MDHPTNQRDFHVLSFYRDRWIATCWWSGLVITSAYFWLLRYFIPFSVEPLNLHYTIYFGIDRIGSWWEMWMLPFFGFIVHLVNFFLIKILYSKDPGIARVGAVCTLLFHLLAGAGVWILIRLNSV